MGGDQNENEGAAKRVGGAPARASPRRAPALASLQPPALTLSQLLGRHSGRIVFPKLFFYKLCGVAGGGI